MLANGENVKPMLTELSAYVADINPSTAQNAIKAMGKIALSVPSSAPDAVTYFLGFLDSELDYIVSQVPLSSCM